MGYKLYASMGTADFYTEHGVDVSVSLFHCVSHTDRNLLCSPVSVTDKSDKRRLMQVQFVAKVWSHWIK
jgi:hypothetical protein